MIGPEDGAPGDRSTTEAFVVNETVLHSGEWAGGIQRFEYLVPPPICSTRGYQLLAPNEAAAQCRRRASDSEAEYLARDLFSIFNIPQLDGICSCQPGILLSLKPSGRQI